MSVENENEAGHALPDHQSDYASATGDNNEITGNSTPGVADAFKELVQHDTHTAEDHMEETDWSKRDAEGSDTQEKHDVSLEEALQTEPGAHETDYDLDGDEEGRNPSMPGRL